MAQAQNAGGHAAPSSYSWTYQGGQNAANEVTSLLDEVGRDVKDLFSPIQGAYDHVNKWIKDKMTGKMRKATPQEINQMRNEQARSQQQQSQQRIWQNQLKESDAAANLSMQEGINAQTAFDKANESVHNRAAEMAERNANSAGQTAVEQLGGDVSGAGAAFARAKAAEAARNAAYTPALQQALADRKEWEKLGVERKRQQYMQDANAARAKEVEAMGQQTAAQEELLKTSGDEVHDKAIANSGTQPDADDQPGAPTPQTPGNEENPQKQEEQKRHDEEVTKKEEPPPDEPKKKEEPPPDDPKPTPVVRPKYKLLAVQGLKPADLQALNLTTKRVVKKEEIVGINKKLREIDPRAKPIGIGEDRWFDPEISTMTNQATETRYFYDDGTPAEKDPNSDVRIKRDIRRSDKASKKTNDATGGFKQSQAFADSDIIDRTLGYMLGSRRP